MSRCDGCGRTDQRVYSLSLYEAECGFFCYDCASKVWGPPPKTVRNMIGFGIAWLVLALIVGFGAMSIWGWRGLCIGGGIVAVLGTFQILAWRFNGEPFDK